MKKKRKYSYAFKQFRKWLKSDNLIRGVDGWRTQCSQYTILFSTRKALYKYFKKEYIIN
jgi:hypothetical protein